MHSAYTAKFKLELYLVVSDIATSVCTHPVCINVRCLARAMCGISCQPFLNFAVSYHVHAVHALLPVYK